MHFFQYLKNPQITDNYRKISVKNFLKILGISYFFMMIVNGIPRLLESLNVIPHNEIDTILGNYSPIIIFIVLVIVGPLAEEAIFRLNLQKSKSNIIFSLIVVLGYLIFRIFTGVSNHNNLIILLLLYLVMVVVSYMDLFLEINTKKYFKFIFYFSAIAFGFMHIFNYSELNVLTLLLFPIITLPQIILGLINGYLRMNYGFTYGVLLHSSVNFIAFIFMLLQGHII